MKLLQILKNNEFYSNLLLIIITLGWSLLFITKHAFFASFVFFLPCAILASIAIPNLALFFSICSLFIFRYSYSEGIISIFPFDLLFILLLLTPLFIFSKVKYKEEKPDKNFITLTLLYIVFFTICIFSFFLNMPHLENTVLYTSIWYMYRCFQLVFLIIVLTWLRITTKNIEKIFDIIILLALVQLPIVIFQTINNDSVTGTFTNHHGYIASFMIIPFFLSIYKGINCYIQKKNILIVSYYFIISAIILYIIYASSCRSILVGLFISSTIFIILLLLNSNFKIIIITLLLVGLFSYVSIKFTPLSDVIERSTNSSETAYKVDLSGVSRILIWKYTWIKFINFPLVTKLFGIGIGTFSFMNLNFVFWNGSKHISGAHFNLFHVLIETGILGILTFMTIFIYKLKILYQYRSHLIAKTGFYMFLSFLLSGFTQETIWFQNSFGVIWFTLLFVFLLILKHISNAELLKK